MKRYRYYYWRIAWVYAAFVLLSLAGLSLVVLVILSNRSLAQQGQSLAQEARLAAPVLLSITVWGLSVGAVLLLLLYRFGRRLYRPAAALGQGLLQLGQGRLDYRAAPPNTPEGSELVEPFNRMADAVRLLVQDLSTERDTLLAVLDTMADGVIVTEPTGRVTLMNPAARDLLALGERELADARLIELVRDHDLHRLVSQCQSGKTRQQGEVALLSPRRYLSAIATPLDNANTPGTLLTLHDLTRIRQVETSQKEFVSNVSHELRNPMAAIRALVETLEAGALNDRKVAADYLRRIGQDVDRINSLVNDLLELSRMESGQFSFAAEPASLNELAHFARSRLARPAEAQQVAIEVAMPADLPLAMVDKGRFGQILANLLENALKFTPSGGRITITGAAGADCLSVTVSDTGVGVAPQHLPHLFERFYKVDRSRRDGGTGLGLAIVKQLVEAQGGRITVDSREGEGCAFTFTAPIAR